MPATETRDIRPGRPTGPEETLYSTILETCSNTVNRTDAVIAAAAAATDCGLKAYDPRQTHARWLAFALGLYGLLAAGPAPGASGFYHVLRGVLESPDRDAVLDGRLGPEDIIGRVRPA